MPMGSFLRGIVMALSSLVTQAAEPLDGVEVPRWSLGTRMA